MKKIRKNRLYAVIFITVSSAIAASLVLLALNQNINLFYSPTDLINDPPAMDKSIRAGGLVELDSLKRKENTLEVNFSITDLKKSIFVSYSGILPDLFKENAGVVATGYYNKETKLLKAYQILAKHDENYMPKEVKEALEK
ncbi:MAG: cytochrome c maturation protein CcmE [Flavobacteriaceae bacterium]|nr:cytochrome c maturation protein CcmE [Flavobacteriaceae bacterium]